MSEHDDEQESDCDFDVPCTGLRALLGDAGCDRLLKETFGLAPRTKRNWDEFDRKPMIYPITQDELTALRNAVGWLACEVSGHSEKCTCGSCGAIAAAARFIPLGADRDKCQRIKARFDIAMAGAK